MPLVKVSEQETRGTHIVFRFTANSPGGKTSAWRVQSSYKGHEDMQLGTVAWFGRWRKYGFFPPQNRSTVFEEVCLREIAEFCETQTKEHRAK
jgi:hypothetical protein